MSKEFTIQDAEILIQVATAAPLQNLSAAKALDELLGRFRVFVQTTFDARTAKKGQEPKQPVAKRDNGQSAQA